MRGLRRDRAAPNEAKAVERDLPKSGDAMEVTP